MVPVRRLLPIALWTFGIVFCVQWLLGLLAFPLLKDRPAGLVPVLAGAAAAWLVLRWSSKLRLTSPLWARATDRQVLTGLVVGSALLRIAAVLVFPLEPMVDDAQFHRSAVSLLDGGPYGTPVYRAFFPPGMTLLLYGWYSLFGPGWLVGKLLNVLIGVGLVATIFEFSRRHFGTAVARVAGLLAALMPTLVFYAATLGYEVFLALIWLWWAWLVLALERERLLTGRLILLGLLIGVAALVNPLSLLLPAVSALLWLRTRGLGVVAARMLVLTVLMLTVVAPWTYRNYQVFGRFVLISTNGGITLYAGNNERSIGLPMVVTPLPGEVDEVTRDQVTRQKAIAWMVAHPTDWARLALAKCVYTWGTASSLMSVVSTDRLAARVEQLCMALLNLSWATLGVLCTVQARRRRGWDAAALAPSLLLVGYVFGVHLFFEALSRHQIPVLPPLIILAALCQTGPAPETERLSV